MWAGDWRRPHHYSTPEDEVDGVRNRVGVIDVSTLGKFRVQGPAGGGPPRAAVPEPVLGSGGRTDPVRGHAERRRGDPRRRRRLPRRRRRVLRDGDHGEHGGARAVDHVVARGLAAGRAGAERHRSVRGAEPGRAERADRHGTRDGRRRVRRGDAVPARAGASTSPTCPRSSCGSGSSGRWATRSTCRACSASPSGARSWRRARITGIAPFGLEAQRILRLEKQHILVGQDTDAESDPYEAGLGWMVKGDKPDFLGKRSLRDLERAGPGERLIGFTSDPAWVPPEGASVVHEGVWVGRVTSARRSAAVGATVGLAWVPAGVGERGNGVRDPVRAQPCRGTRGAAAVLRSRRGEAPVVSDHRVASVDRAGSDVPAAAALAARVDPRRLRVGRDDRGRSRDASGPTGIRTASVRPSPAPSAWPISRCCRRSTSGAR